MGIGEDYQKVIDLLVELRNKIAVRRIRFADLGEELIAELIQAGFGLEELEKKDADREFVQAYVANYNGICKLQKIDAEIDFLNLMLAGIQWWKEKEEEKEKENLLRMQKMQEKLLPKELHCVDEDGVKHIMVEPRELLLQQNASLKDIDYQRLDVVVKYLAIENYFEKNTYGFEIYRKLQKARRADAGGETKGVEQMAESVFSSLIQSIEEKGFLEESEISCDEQLQLLDGAHRLAACLYFKVPKVRVKVIKDTASICPFTMEYLNRSGLTEEELNHVREKAEELLNENCVENVCILWPPVMKYFDELTGIIGNTFHVSEWKDYEYSEETFPRIVRGIYHVDDIADWKIQKKIDAMASCSQKKLRVLKLKIMSPHFRLKDLNFHTISTVGEQLKSIIRNQYKDLVENYIYDIIIHTADNFYQSEYMNKLFEQVFSLENYFERINKADYFLIKHNTPYTPQDFPKSYAFSKDIDIICSKEDYCDLEQETAQFLEETVSGYEIRKIKKDTGMLFRVELLGFLIIQIDLGIAVDGINEAFWREALARKEECKGFYIPTVKDEICIRVNEFLKNSRKLHHLQYIKEHIEDYDKNILNSYLGYTEEQYQELEEQL